MGVEQNPSLIRVILRPARGNVMTAGCSFVPRAPWKWALIMIMLASLGGCKRGGSGSNSNPTSAVLTVDDINEDGSINAAGISKLDAQASAPSMTVAFARVRASDAALAQLAKYPNVRVIKAPGSQFSQEAIDKLKAAVADVKIN